MPRRQTGREILQELDDGEDAHSDGGFDLFNPVGGGGAVGRLLQRLLGTARSKGKGSPGAESATHRTTRGGKVARGAAVSSTRAELTEDLAALRRGEMTYPEWNVFARRYRPDWCTVTEVEPTAAATEVRPAPEAARAAPNSSPAWVSTSNAATVNRRATTSTSTPPSRRASRSRPGRRRTTASTSTACVRRRDLSVLILLDISGSAAEPSDSGGSVHDHQLAAAAALTQALHELGDRVALYGFRSLGRSAVQVVPVKRFGDPFGTSTLRRMRGLVPGGYTRLGAAIRHGSSVLEAEGGTVRRLLVVLSDGFAYDHGYEGAYGEADARRALAEARRRGTACLCLSIGAGVDAASLRRVFGTAAHASLPRVGQLTTTRRPALPLRAASRPRCSGGRPSATNGLVSVC